MSFKNLVKKNKDKYKEIRKDFKNYDSYVGMYFLKDYLGYFSQKQIRKFL